MHSQTIDNTGKGLRSLNRAMRGNGIFSGISAIILLLAAKPLASFMGLQSQAVLIVLAIVLLIYAMVLYQLTSRPLVDRRLGYIAVILDVAWVIGSAAILISGRPALSVAGRWIVVLLAEAVAIFAIWQAYSLRSSRE